MTNIIMTLTRLSFLTSIMALIVLGIRFCLRKAPKTYTYILWIFVFIRAIMPASYTSDYSLWNLMQSFFSTHQTTAPATNAETLKAISKPFAFPRDAAAAVSQTKEASGITVLSSPSSVLNRYLFHKPKKRPSQRKTCSTHGS